MKKIWLFKKLNLSLRTEVIINISFLMLAAILLIGFTTSKIIELSIIDERKSYGEKMIQDFQVVLDFMIRDKKELSLDDLVLQKEIQNFVYRNTESAMMTLSLFPRTKQNLFSPSIKISLII